ncbi:cyclase family protein [Caldinitratiruptor microaerophilus]|nr:cyclase family protein [Caldinitratiruptor microaerophilus]
MRIHDVSMPIHPGMPVYRNREEKRPAFAVTRDFDAQGAGVRETRVSLDTHTGTHVDAPLHLFPDGTGVDRLPLEALVGPCRVLDLTGVPGGIRAADLAPHGVRAGEFVLLKTRNSLREGFDPSFVYLTAGAAAFLAGRGVRGVGIDALGIERDQPGHPTHRTLLGRGIVVLEGLRLGTVPPGEYWLAALPLRLIGLDAAPARVVLVEMR